MKYTVLFLLLSALPGWGWLRHVQVRNEALAQARAAYQRGDAAGAAAGFRRALAAGPAPSRDADPRLLLNLAHAQAQAGQLAAARATYGQLLSAARVPAGVGSVARQQLAVLTASAGQYAQALSLLRQALTLDPANTGARYDYEVLREFLARHPEPQLPPPAPAGPAPQPVKKPVLSAKDSASVPRPAPRPGADRPGQTPDAEQPSPPAGQPQPRPDASGRPDPARPDPTRAGSAAKGGLGPGNGVAQPLPTGRAGGPQRGLNAGAPPGAPQRTGRRPGTEAATDADQQLQTQRERLRQLNLSPAQARQLLDALRAQEAQYLQQRPRPAAKRPRPGEPTW